MVHDASIQQLIVNTHQALLLEELLKFSSNIPRRPTIPWLFISFIPPASRVLHQNERDPVDLVVGLASTALEGQVPELAVAPSRCAADSFAIGTSTVLAAGPPVVGTKCVALGEAKILNAAEALRLCSKPHQHLDIRENVSTTKAAAAEANDQTSEKRKVELVRVVAKRVLSCWDAGGPPVAELACSTPTPRTLKTTRTSWLRLRYPCGRA